MKKIAYFLSVMFLFTAMAPASMAKSPNDKNKTELTAEEQARMAEIGNRVEEIKGMTFSDMSKDELRSVKKELKELNKEAKNANNGIYLSVGAIIVILLIILLVR